ncbi:MAG: hypothetical protein HOP29_10445 [Phycisphaerales bacterium]|nr:hypothetical protein [Phycisphaerales bacterium]
MSETPIQKVLAALERTAGHKPIREGAGWSARCPSHEDTNPSLSVGVGDNGAVVLCCHAGCPSESITSAIGLTMSDLFPPREKCHTAASAKSNGKGKLGRIVAVYDYRSGDGDVVFQVVRFDPKGFRQRRRGPGGKWIWQMDGVERVLYRLPELLAADPARTVFVCEGEKDCDTLARLGLIATCNPGGAGKWRKVADTSALNGRNVVIIPDRDDAGRKHAAQVAMALSGKAASIRVLELPGDNVKDATDWVPAGGTADELRALANAAPVYQTTDDDGSDADNIDGPGMGQEIGERDPVTGKLILSSSDPLPSARVFIRERFRHDGMNTLRHYAGSFRVWRGNRYIPVEDDGLRADVYRFTEDAVIAKTMPEGGIVFGPFKPTSGKVGNLIDAAAAETFLSAELTPPIWLDGDDARPPTDELILCRSGTLHIPTRQWYPPTPMLFSTSALEFDYDAYAPIPKQWTEFLKQLWPDDQASIESLQEIFGYCISSNTPQQKMFLLVGPKRSGKGTIGRVLGALVGHGNVVGPTMSSLAGPFGLQPLIGKSVAIVSDARFTMKTDFGVVVERLLTISGEDSVTIDRKNIPSLTVRLPTRFVFLTNEIPRVADTWGALAGRFIVLTLRESFFGREDVTLTDRLLTERPGILNWALKGWERLRARGHFLQPGSAADAVQHLADLGSPVSAFTRDRCTVGGGLRCELRRLYAAYREWCVERGRDRIGTDAAFSRDLAAAVPSIRRTRPRGSDNSKGTVFDGIGLLVQDGTCTTPSHDTFTGDVDDDDDHPQTNVIRLDQKSAGNGLVHVPSCTTPVSTPKTRVPGDDTPTAAMSEPADPLREEIGRHLQQIERNLNARPAPGPMAARLDEANEAAQVACEADREGAL